MQILTITLPIPPRTLNENAHIMNWRIRSRAVKSYKEAAYIATLDAINRNPEFQRALPLGFVELIPTMYFGSNRRRDKDNWNPAFKAAQDGIEAAGVVLNDSTATTQTPTLEVDGSKPRVEIVIREIVIREIAVAEPAESED